MNIHKNTGTKWTALAMAAAVLVLSPFDGAGISTGCSWMARLSYPIFHVTLLHALCNAWCLITLVFYYDLNCRKILTAYLIAVTIPSFILSAAPAVGMSGLCFALMGLTTFVVERRGLITSCVAVFLAVGFLFKSAAASIHLYCYLVGLFVAFLTTPIVKR